MTLWLILYCLPFNRILSLKVWPSGRNHTNSTTCWMFVLWLLFGSRKKAFTLFSVLWSSINTHLRQKLGAIPDFLSSCPVINWWPRTINSTSLTFFRWVQHALAPLPHPGSFTYQAPARNFAINLVYCPPVAPTSLLFQAAAAAAAKSLQSCPTLCDPIDSSPLGSSVPGILQARTLEWVAISFSNAWKWKVKSLSHSVVSNA